MDPNAALAEIRSIIASFESDPDFDSGRLIDLVEALDGWMSKGGFAPFAWGKR